MIETTIGVVTGTIDTYRNVEPKQIIPSSAAQLESAWTRKTGDGVGKRNELVQKAYDIEPGTPVSSAS